MIAVISAGRRHLFHRDEVNAWASSFGPTPRAACGVELEERGKGSAIVCVKCLALWTPDADSEDARWDRAARTSIRAADVPSGHALPAEQSAHGSRRDSWATAPSNRPAAVADSAGAFSRGEQ